MLANVRTFPGRSQDGDHLNKPSNPNAVIAFGPQADQPAFILVVEASLVLPFENPPQTRRPVRDRFLATYSNSCSMKCPSISGREIRSNAFSRVNWLVKIRLEK